MAVQPAGRQAHGPCSSAYVWFFLAMAHHRLGRPKEAREYLVKAVHGAKEDSQKAGTAWNRRPEATSP